MDHEIEKITTGNIHDIIDALENATKALLLVVCEDYTLVDACKKNGIRSGDLKKLVHTKAMRDLSRGIIDDSTIKEFDKRVYDGYTLLYSHVFGVDVDDVVMPEDARETVDSILDSEIVNSTEKQALEMKYCLHDYEHTYEDVTYTSIAKELDLSTQCISSSVAHVLRKMHHPITSNRLRLGNKKFNEAIEISKERADKRIKEDMEKFIKTREDDIVGTFILMSNTDPKLYESSRYSRYTKRESNPYAVSIDIGYLDLNSREINALCRHGIDTLFDIIITPDEELECIRGLGKEGYTHIIDIKDEYCAKYAKVFLETMSRLDGVRDKIEKRIKSDEEIIKYCKPTITDLYDPEEVSLTDLGLIRDGYVYTLLEYNIKNLLDIFLLDDEAFKNMEEEKKIKESEIQKIKRIRRDKLCEWGYALFYDLQRKRLAHKGDSEWYKKEA